MSAALNFYFLTTSPQVVAQVIPYTYFYSEEDEGYIAHLVAMPSMSAFSETKNEAVQDLRSATKDLIDMLMKDGRRLDTILAET